MKVLTLIPKKIKQKYAIERDKDMLSIHKPAFVNIDFDNRFRIKKDSSGITISNSKCAVNLWKNNLILHITIFK